MSRHKVPCWGPHKGQLVGADGAPLPERDTSGTPPPVAVPETIASMQDADHKRGSVSLMQGQLVDAGWSASRAREIAVAAAQRSDGAHTAYPEHAAHRHVEGDR